MKDSLNDWMHTPLGGYLSYHIWWSIVALIKLPVSFIFFAFSFLFGGFKLVFGNKIVPKNTRSTKLVAISGCDTGFGHELAILLSKKSGYVVLAGCLNKDSEKKLKDICGDNLFTTTLDVTKDTSVESFMASMKEILNPNDGSNKVTLHALVNNAGIMNLGAIDWMKMDQFRLDMEVNYFGVVRLTKACLPIMKDIVIAQHGSNEAPPRIVNVTSVAGLVPFPFLGSYCATKHAAEAFTASLRMELKSWGIHVVTLNPSCHKTPIATGAADTMIRCWRNAGPEIQNQYGEPYVETMCAKSLDMVDKATWDPMNVVIQMEQAISLYQPRSQYLIGLDARCGIPLLRWLPTWFSEMLTGFSMTFFLPTPVKLSS